MFIFILVLMPIDFGARERVASTLDRDLQRKGYTCKIASGSDPREGTWNYIIVSW